MSYGPDGLAPENLAQGYISGAVGGSWHALLGIFVLIITIPFGLTFIYEDDLWQGLAWIFGGVALTVSLFGLAARRDRKMNLSSRHAWYLDKHNLVISVALMIVGGWIFLVSREYAELSNLALYTGGFGVVVFVVAIIWFSLSVRD